jgi:hypothetical protein
MDPKMVPIQFFAYLGCYYCDGGGITGVYSSETGGHVRVICSCVEVVPKKSKGESDE